MSLAKIWVYKRHAQYPHLPPGQFHYVPEVSARVLIDAGCADDWQTDGKHLHQVDYSEVVGMPVPEPKRAPSKRGRYKRRDMNPENP